MDQEEGLGSKEDFAAAVRAQQTSHGLRQFSTLEGGRGNDHDHAEVRSSFTLRPSRYQPNYIC
eukprot:scaffold5570_cov87-Skeletonema_dohrnii-CCMP3373.AAC.9